MNVAGGPSRRLLRRTDKTFSIWRPGGYRWPAIMNSRSNSRGSLAATDARPAKKETALAKRNAAMRLAQAGDGHRQPPSSVPEPRPPLPPSEVGALSHPPCGRAGIFQVKNVLILNDGDGLAARLGIRFTRPLSCRIGPGSRSR